MATKRKPTRKKGKAGAKSAKNVKSTKRPVKRMAKSAGKAKSVKRTNKKILIGVAIAAGVLLVIALISSAFGKLFSGKPGIEIDGVAGTVLSEEGSTPIEISGDLEIDCVMQNSIGSDLKPVTGGKNASSATGVDPTYLKYSNLTCAAEIDGTYGTGGRYDPTISVESTDGFKLSDNSQNSFTIKKDYDIYANGVGMPNDEANKIVIKLTAKDSDKGNAVKETLAIYTLNVKVGIKDSDRTKISEWKKKVDEKEAEEKRKAEEAAKAAEEARQKAEAEAAQQKQNALSNAVSPSYTDLFRNSANYRGKYIRIVGRIVQTDSSNSYCRVATKKSYGTYYDDVIYVSPCSTSTKLLEDDIVTIVGRGNGTKTYTTVLGASVEIPMIRGEYFALQNK